MLEWDTAQRALALIKTNEGLRLFCYRDTKGIPTIGYGRNLADKGLSENEANILLAHDLSEVSAALAEYRWFSALEPPRQAAVIDMMFTLGASRFRAFERFIEAMAKGDHLAASAQILNSLWAREAKDRAQRDARMIERGEWPE